MEKVVSVKALEILDSRGVPTLCTWVRTTSGYEAMACVPSGASTGEHEALELRDTESSRYFHKGVQRAIAYVEGPLFEAIASQEILDQKGIDQALITADGTLAKSRYGANSILSLSLAIARAAAASQKLPLYRYLQSLTHASFSLPLPMMNIINGGAHADNLLDFQEFMIRPVGISSFKEQVRAGSEIFYHLKNLLKKKHLTTAVGDEGGFAPQLLSHEEALSLIVEAITQAGYVPGQEITLALDCAASEFFTSPTYFDKKKKIALQPYQMRTSKEQIDLLETLTSLYPIDSIEDGLDQNDWEGWALWTQRMGKKIQIVGDDLFVTNPLFLSKGIERRVANAILIKLNQIGTLSETLATIDLAHKNGYKTIISHRSGETEDTFIADLAVGTGAGQIKTGSLSRSERVAKYNRLLQIEQELLDLFPT